MMTMPLKGFSPRKLRELREERADGISSRQLSIQAGFPRPYGEVRKWESGLSTPSLKRLRVIADLLGCSPRDLFDVQRGEEELVHLRMWAGLSSEEVALQVKISYVAYRRLEQGVALDRTILGSHQWKRLAQVLMVGEEEVRAAWRYSSLLRSRRRS
ncbi:helix-turn-helix domain-containing protein [Streptomyces sp. NPDC091040]|uniref:helix-turn-helix domain-containing protein n=1 Tax=Streptomyces sp. NPDC091040 TaxID=3365972 RepID=UPI0038197740